MNSEVSGSALNAMIQVVENEDNSAAAVRAEAKNATVYVTEEQNKESQDGMG